MLLAPITARRLVVPHYGEDNGIQQYRYYLYWGYTTLFIPLVALQGFTPWFNLMVDSIGIGPMTFRTSSGCSPSWANCPYRLGSIVPERWWELNREISTSSQMVESAGIEPTFTGSRPVSLPLTELSILPVFYLGPDFLVGITKGDIYTQEFSWHHLW